MRRNRAEETLGIISRNSPAWNLYDSLKRGAEADIRSKRQQDEVLLQE